MTVTDARGPHADPNVTSLIDVLLIIFMAIVPITPKGLTALYQGMTLVVP